MTEETARPPLATTSGNETILLVEDEEVIRMMLREILTIQGYTILEAGLPAAALKLAENHPKPIHLLVTDMSMPGMNGWELARVLRKTRKGIPVLFISGHNDHETAQWGRIEPPMDNLHKPFTLEAFLHKARQMLDSDKAPAPPQPSPPTAPDAVPAENP